MVSFSEIYLGVCMLRPMQYIEFLVLREAGNVCVRSPFLKPSGHLGPVKIFLVSFYSHVSSFGVMQDALGRQTSG